MRTIGIRAKPHEIAFVIFDSDQRTILNSETIKIPKALSRPEALKYLRNNILDVLREYSVDFAGLRVAESTARTINIARIGIEGVIQEAFASSTLKGYYCGQIATISRRVRIQRQDFNRFVNNELVYESVENWADLSREEREATLTAIGATTDA